MAQPKFETALARLESIVTQLEKGDLPLESALKIFEEGVRLSKTCLKMLDEAEKKVEILLKSQGGKKRPRHRRGRRKVYQAAICPNSQKRHASKKTNIKLSRLVPPDVALVNQVATRSTNSMMRSRHVGSGIIPPTR